MYTIHNVFTFSHRTRTVISYCICVSFHVLIKSDVIPRDAGCVVYCRLDHHTVPPSAWSYLDCQIVPDRRHSPRWISKPHLIGGYGYKTLQPVAPVNEEFSLSQFTLHRSGLSSTSWSDCLPCTCCATYQQYGPPSIGQDHVCPT